jgi:hypothetical protein
MTDESTRDDDSRDDDKGTTAPLETFLHQPALHADEDDSPSPTGEVVLNSAHVGFWRAINNFMFNKRPSEYSSLAPRGAEGRRSRIFFFNGNGRGRYRADVGVEVVEPACTLGT